MRPCVHFVAGIFLLGSLAFGQALPVPTQKEFVQIQAAFQRLRPFFEASVHGTCVMKST